MLKNEQFSIEHLQSLEKTGETLDQLEQYLLALDKEYTYGESPVSDQEYDILKEFLQSCRPTSKVLNKVGHIPEKELVTLPVWMGSLDKVKPETSALVRFLKNPKYNFVISEKLDGISLLLQRHENIWRCFTRGNGTIGQDVTGTLLKYIAIPDSQQLEEHGNIIIRGEFILPKSTMELLDTSKNLRTIVSGVVNAKKPKLEVLTLCKFVAYSLPESNLIPSQQFRLLHKFGFEVPKLLETHSSQVTPQVLEKTLLSWKKHSLYDIDGIVVAKDIFEPLKSNSNPKEAVAFKVTLDTDSKTTSVIDVEWNTTKDGYLKPVVIVETVNIEGCNISRVTGNNAKYVFSKKIGKGAKVKVIRSGHVIPKIVKVVKPWTESSIPKIECVWNTTNTDLIAKTVVNKPQQLLYFIKTIGIKYLNVSLCDHLVDAGIDTPEKLCSMTQETLLTLPNMGDKSATKIYQSIHHYMAKSHPIQLIVGLNILGRNIGINRLQLVVDKIGIDAFVEKMDGLEKTTLLEINGFSDKLATQLVNGLVKVKGYLEENPTINDYFIRAVEQYQKTTSESIVSSSDKCQHLNVVFTGFRDKALETYITSNGGKIGTTISKNTSHLVIKDQDNAKKSSKMEKAASLGISILTADQFKIYLESL